MRALCEATRLAYCETPLWCSGKKYHPNCQSRLLSPGSLQSNGAQSFDSPGQCEEVSNSRVRRSRCEAGSAAYLFLAGSMILAIES